MVQPLTYLKETPSQTAGPYVHIGLAPQAVGIDTFEGVLGGEIAGPEAEGARVTVEGRVLDGTGAPVKDALIEAWHCDGAGRFGGAGDGFRCWGRIVPDFETGAFSFSTVKPGAAGGQAPHVSLWIVARGINLGLHTRMYFPEDDHSADPLLARVESPARRATLIAAAEGAGRYRFDIRLQGERETVFLDI